MSATVSYQLYWQCLFLIITVAQCISTHNPLATDAPCNTSLPLGYYTLKCDAQGNIQTPWSSLAQAIAAEVEWYMDFPPADHGFPTYGYSTFVNGNRRYGMCIIKESVCMCVCVLGENRREAVIWNESMSWILFRT